MQHRIREAFADVAFTFSGPVEVDEAYFGGLHRNMSNARRKELAGTGRGPVGKTAVVVAKDRATKRVVAKVIAHTGSETLRGFVDKHASDDSKLCTDNATAWEHEGVYPKLSPKHLQRYVNEFAGRQNIRELDTIDQMAHIVARMVGRRLMYRDLIVNNGWSALAG